MKHVQLVFRLAILCFTGLLFSGCNSASDVPKDLPKLTPTVLAFTQEGQPLVKATISLAPVEGGQTWFPSGVTDDKGEVDLYTNGKYQGVPAGKYKIVVTKTETDESKLGPEPEEGSPGYAQWMEQSSREVLNSYNLVEKQYTTAQTTPLEIEIPAAEGSTTFDVGKAVKIKR